MSLWRVSLDAVVAGLNLGSMSIKDGVGVALAKVAAAGFAAGDNLLGVLSIIAGVAQSGYAPQPSSIAGSARPLANIDPSGNLQVRSQATSDEGSFSDDFPGASLLTALTGTLVFTNGSNVVSGIGTHFISELTTDYYIRANAEALGESALCRVSKVIDDTNLELGSNWPGVSTPAGAASSKQFWVTVTAAGATIAVANSLCTITQPVDDTFRSAIARTIDYAPIYSALIFSINNRRANQEIFAGLIDTISPSIGACFYFDGVVNTVIKCRTFTADLAAARQETTVSLPHDATTATAHLYEVRCYQDKCVFYLDDNPVTVHRYHLPPPYATLRQDVVIHNTGVVAGVTAIAIDEARTENIDRIDVTATQPVGSKLNLSDGSPDLSPVPVEYAQAAADFVKGTAVTTLLPYGVYFLEIWADPSAAGGSASDDVYGIYKCGSADPATDQDGIPIRGGMTRRLCWPAGGDLWVRKAATVGFPCRWKIWRKQ
jgi:hypothetical protein